MYIIFYIDPDLQYLNNKNYSDKLRKCTYYSEDSFNKKCYPLIKGGNFLSLLHVNARSAPKNLDKNILFLQNINIDFSVVGVSETWLNDSNVDRGLHVISQVITMFAIIGRVRGFVKLKKIQKSDKNSEVGRWV